jgi:hypothetical protein
VADLLAHLRRERVTHILVIRPQKKPRDAHGRRLLAELLASHARLVHEGVYTDSRYRTLGRDKQPRTFAVYALTNPP